MFGFPIITLLLRHEAVGLKIFVASAVQGLKVKGFIVPMTGFPGLSGGVWGL